MNNKCVRKKLKIIALCSNDREIFKAFFMNGSNEEHG
jgi:hypothetical protein